MQHLSIGRKVYTPALNFIFGERRLEDGGRDDSEPL